MDLCRCGHPRAAHEHYRAGTDCAQCDCPRYRAKHPLRAGWQRVTRTLRQG
jgi:hypothetical protein